MKIAQTFAAVLVPVAVLCSGCGKATDGGGNMPATDPSAEGADSEGGDIAVQLAKLSPEDKAAAEAQRVCPVSGQPLGSMGVPPKVAVSGQDVFLCCAHCEGKLQEDPDKYLQKLAN